MDSCRSCRFWWDGYDHKSVPPEHRQNADYSYYQCHRRSPKLSQDSYGAQWPRTYGRDWCGEYEATWTPAIPPDEEET